ncbi:2-hydroxyacyl-CoA dehydratase family protein [Clostridium sp. WILCCON 0269]|uniref:2-hydroxyacyl-CoA dehydratase family protein n=1 Tax=Candidatus Clostridium eludens TaxID=3381663 RepID=A0ABW8SF14_9CLOT
MEDKAIGITTTIPYEVLAAAGYKVVDLNNIFVTSKNYNKFIDMAERQGFPKSCCAWQKGLFGVCMDKKIHQIVGVTEGDCSNTKALEGILDMKGIKIYSFPFPQSHDIHDIKASIDKFINTFNVSYDEVEKVRQRVNKVRCLIKCLDELTYKENKVSGFENHLYQVSASDFNGDIYKFEKDIRNKLKEVEKRKPFVQKLRLGFIGVPPMPCDIYDYVEEFNARFVYNEVQREFAFPRAIKAKNIYEQYYDYTYPYDIKFRLKEIQKQIKERQIDALIHYTQAFCHRQIEDIVIKNKLNIPILTIEGDKLNFLDARTKIRLEAFLDMLEDLIIMNRR